MFTGADLFYQESTFDIAVMVMDLTPEEQKGLCEQVVSLDGVEKHALIREISTESCQGRARFSSFFQKNFLDQNRLPADEAGRYRYYFHLLALGEEEFNNYTAENNLDAVAFSGAEELRGILINKTVTRETKKLAEFAPLQLKAGDKLALAGLVCDQGGSKAALTIEIGAVTDSYPLGVQPADIGYSYLLLSETSFEAARTLLRDEGNGGDSARDTLQLYLITDGNTSLAEQIRAICESTGQGHTYVHDISAELQEMARTKTVIGIFLYGFITLITLIGVTNIFNTISTNVALRRREFAMLKSVGLTPGGFNKMINYESIFYGLNALLYGLPVSVLIALWLHHGFGNMLQFAFFLPWKEIFICIAGVFVIVFMTMLHAGSSLKRDNIIEALKEENL